MSTGQIHCMNEWLAALTGKFFLQPGIWSKSLSLPDIPFVIYKMRKYKNISGFQAGVPNP